jgi:hypothetical protein
MKFFLTLLIMTTIGLAAAMVVVVDQLLRWLPVLVVAAAAFAAVRISRRWRHPHPRGTTVHQALVNVPEVTAFAAIRSSTAYGAPAGVHRPPPIARRVVVDGTVIDEDGHRG